MIFILTSFS